MRILKASAGSGKTYNLSKSYIDILMSSDDRWAYRHILAVTFTNKATAEMKSRILRDLAELAKTEPKAQRILTDILHDYSAFAISTIDRFFQQVLHAFSRETGHFGAYQVELDKKSLINESMDRILDSITEDDKELIKWISSSASEHIERGERIKIEEGLYDMGTRLKNEEHRSLAEKYGIDDISAFDKSKLHQLRQSCRQIINEFQTGALALGYDGNEDEKFKRPGVRKLDKNPELANWFDDRYALYNTACTLDEMIDNLGLAGEFYRQFDALLKEKNVLPLDDSNTILRDIIDGSDAPFVYEKMGVRFSDFLLDEFQDTSDVQWENFQPLLTDNESRGGRNLIVGDVKQSIYRWRGSQWKLLGEKVQDVFPGAEIKSLQGNWRSTRAVVDFNSRFFTFAANILNLGAIYSDVGQEPMTKDPQSGHVRVSFVDDQMTAVVDSIRAALSQGAALGDIAILVRTGDQGGALAQTLLSEGLDVISDDSLDVKSSPVIRRLTALLQNFDTPDDSISNFLAAQLGITFPRSFHSLYELCESILRSLRDADAAAFDGETLFINAFMDDVQDWSSRYGNNLSAFLEHWRDSSLKISSPDDADAIRILTVHKSKGLEFPYVIFPFADKVNLYKADTHWCPLTSGASGLEAAVGGIYPVNLTKESDESLFSESYQAEREMQKIDNLNVFYVAMTRASKSLHVIAAQPPKKLRESKNPQAYTEWSNMSQLLFVYCNCNFDSTVGTPYDFHLMTREDGKMAKSLPCEYESIPIDGRLRASDKASDFFGSDGTAGSDASGRLYGIVLHDILAQIGNAKQTGSDSSGSDGTGCVRAESGIDSAVGAAVNAAVLSGALDAASAADATALLCDRIHAHSEWFADGCVVRNESAIIDTDGNEWRPDRVVEYPDGRIVIVDYKFGEEQRDSYLRQVGRYMQLYRRMGFDDVRGFVWYLRSDTVIPV